MSAAVQLVRSDLLALIVIVFNWSDRILPVMFKPSAVSSLIMPGIRPRAVIPIMIMTGKSSGGQREYRQSGHDCQHVLY